MRKFSFLNSLAVLLVAALSISPLTTASVAVAAASAPAVLADSAGAQAIHVPVLKWQRGGC